MTFTLDEGEHGCCNNLVFKCVSLVSLFKFGHASCVSSNRYIKEVENKLNRLKVTGSQGNRFEDRLRKWRLDIKTSASEDKASIERADPLRFHGSEARINKGSWNLQRVVFSR